MNKNTIGEPNGASTAFSLPMPSRMHNAGASSAVTAIGTDSQTQNTSVQASTAARRCASGVSPGSGAASTAANASGPSHQPVRCLPRSKACSQRIQRPASSSCMGDLDLGPRIWTTQNPKFIDQNFMSQASLLRLRTLADPRKKMKFCTGFSGEAGSLTST